MMAEDQDLSAVTTMGMNHRLESGSQEFWGIYLRAGVSETSGHSPHR